MQSKVKNGPAAPTTHRIRISPALVGVAFNSAIILRMNEEISALPEGHDFKAFTVSLGDNGSALIDLPRRTPREIQEGFVTWFQDLERKLGYTIDPYRTTNTHG